MKKKGFTLIELLAVIVILAIIALIATPIIMNVIENVKKGAAERSADNYMSAVETSIAAHRIANGLPEDGLYRVMGNGHLCKVNNDCATKADLQVDVSGDIPEVGSGVEIKDGQVSKEESLVKFNGYEVRYSEEAPTAEEPKDLAKIEDVCSLVSGNANEVGAQYTCDLGDGDRTFYVLEAATLVKPATLILSENYDNTLLTWCANTQATNSCAADGLTEKLDEIANAWTKLDETQLGLPTANQILAASKRALNKPAAQPIPLWLSPIEKGYWTSTPSTDWPVYDYMVVQAIKVVKAVQGGGWVDTDNVSAPASVRPVVKLPVDIFGDSTN